MKPAGSIEPASNPGGLVAHLIVDGEVVDASPLATLAGAELVGGRHGAANLRARGEGIPPQRIEVRVFDGDSGDLVCRLATP